MFGNFTGAVATKAGEAVGDALQTQIRSIVAERSAGSLSSATVDVIARRVRDGMRNVDRMERSGTTAISTGAFCVGAVFGFAIVYSLVHTVPAKG